MDLIEGDAGILPIWVKAYTGTELQGGTIHGLTVQERIQGPALKMARRQWFLRREFSGRSRDDHLVSSLSPGECTYVSQHLRLARRHRRLSQPGPQASGLRQRHRRLCDLPLGARGQGQGRLIAVEDAQEWRDHAPGRHRWLPRPLGPGEKR